MNNRVFANEYGRLFYNDVKAFHDKFGLETPKVFQSLEPKLLEFRTKFFNEELTEFRQGCEEADVAQCADALIDLLYITAGAAALHGITSDQFDAAIFSLELFDNSVSFYDSFDQETRDLSPDTPDTPQAHVALRFYREMTSLIQVHSETDETNRMGGYSPEQAKIATSLVLAKMTTLSFDMLFLMGCQDDCIRELWDDVQRANMTKERVLSASQSKRGSAYDIIKPAGWQPPDTAGIIARYQELDV